MISLLNQVDECPKCGYVRFRYSHRKFWERFLNGLARPYRCLKCGNRFWRVKKNIPVRQLFITVVGILMVAFLWLLLNLIFG